MKKFTGLSMRYLEKCSHILLLSAMVVVFTTIAHADLNKVNLGISKWSGDTTLKGFSNRDNEKFRNHSKKQMLAYEKEYDIKLFSIVNDETRYGKTAFFVQAPSEGCYNRREHDCERKAGERQKRVEAHYSAFDGGEHWFTVSIKFEDWALNDDEIILTQFHSDVPQYQNMLSLKIDNWKGLFLEHQSANGFQFVEGGSEECAGGAAEVLTEDKMYCPKLKDIYKVMLPSKIERDVWYDFVYHVNFDKSNRDQEFIKLWFNGELVVNNQGQGKTLWWATMPGIEEQENRITFHFGIYGSKKDSAFHSAYFDEVHKSKSCEKLKIDRLGYNCKDLIKQTEVIKPTWHDTPDLPIIAAPKPENKYWRDNSNLVQKFECFIQKANELQLNNLPSEDEIKEAIKNITDNKGYLRPIKIIEAGISKAVFSDHKKRITRLVNYEGDAAKFCQNPILG